jgi:hypothetical protein
VVKPRTISPRNRIDPRSQEPNAGHDLGGDPRRIEHDVLRSQLVRFVLDRASLPARTPPAHDAPRSHDGLFLRLAGTSIK